MAKESDLESVLMLHPYLLDPALESVKSQNQISKGKSRLDIKFDVNGYWSIAELKKETLKIKDLEQLQDYLKKFGRTNPLHDTHYLVGFKPSAEKFDSINIKASRSKYRIKVLILGIDIPLKLTWDGRKYHRFNEDKPAPVALELKF